MPPVLKRINNLKTWILCCVACLGVLQAAAQVPAIVSFSPASGPTGTTVTINGSNFSTTAANNIVFFGAVRATVSAATAGSLTVIVPAGATNEPITVTTNNLTAYSSNPFMPTIAGGGVGFNTGSFAAKIDSTTGLYPYGIVAVDLDGDGKPDLATANNANSPVSIMSVLRNSGGAGVISFEPRIDFPTPAGGLLYSVAAGDLDGDGKPDLVVTGYDKTMSVFRNTSSPGAVSLAARVDFTTGAGPYTLVINDLDGDGKPDVAVSNYSSHTLSLFKNTSSPGTISFAAKVDLATGFSPHTVVTGDLDGDGKPDLAVCNSFSNNISVFRNLGGGGTMAFSAKSDVATGSDMPFGLAIGDLDGDGKADLVVSNNNVTQIALTAVSFSLLRNTGSAGTISFAAPKNYSGLGETYYVSLADLDGDGKLDIVAPSASNLLAVYQNTSTPGAFALSAGIRYYTNSGYRVAAGDFDGDNLPDLAVANFVWDKVSLFKSRVMMPVITSLSPSVAGTGVTVNISGANFTGATAVSFGGVPSTSFTVVNAGLIKAVVGAGATGDVQVTTSYGTASLSGFIFTGPPTITSFTPPTGGKDSVIMVTGTNLMGTTAVTFGGTPAASFTVSSPTKLTAVVGTGASGYVAVKSDYGTDSIAGFTFIPPPVITSFTPAFGAAGAVITITGANFTGAMAVRFGGIPAASFTVVSATTITAVVGAGATGAVSVTTPGGTASRTGFTATPVITSFSPSAAGFNNTVTIRGKYFTGATDVSFGGTPARAFTVDSDTGITASVGTGATGSVTVTTAGGTGSLAGFTFIPPPTVTSFLPIAGGSGDTITITGTDFGTVGAVTFGNAAAASFTIVSPGVITAVVGSGASGSITVQSIGGTGSKYGFLYSTIPIITSVYPLSAPVGATVTIKGANFGMNTGDNTVYFGAVKAIVTAAAKTQLIVKVPAGATYVPVSVATNNFVASSNTPFNTSFNGGIITASSFGGKTDFATGQNPESVAIGDLDGDGRPDLAVANYNSNTISVYRNTSVGNVLSFAAKYDLATINHPHAVKAYDIDGDGKLDLVFLNTNLNTPALSSYDTITIIKNTGIPGALSFSPAIFLTVDQGPAGMAIGDLDGNGKPDIAVNHGGYLGGVTYGSVFLTLCMNQSTKDNILLYPYYHPKPPGLTGSYPYTIASALISDLNGNYKPDLLAGTDLPYYFYISENLGANFAQVSPPGIDPHSAISCLGDLDGDGLPDFLTDNSIYRNTTTIYTGYYIYPFSLGSKLTYPMGRTISLCDLNGDGKPDVTTLLKTDTITVLMNTSTTGNISMGAGIDFPVSAHPQGIALGDLNGDGKPDIVTVNSPSNTISILLNSANASSAPAITSFTPVAGPGGTTITITGTKLSGATDVSIGGVTASSFTVVSSTTITAVVGAGASGAVSVTTPYGTAALDGFTCTSPPVIYSFNPVAADSGKTVGISGINFTGATAVDFGGVAVKSFTVISPFYISAVLGAGASGNVTVKTPYGTATLAGFTFYYVPAAPVVTPGGPVTVCSGTPVTLSSSDTANQWYKDNVLMAGATGVTLQVTATGLYTVKTTAHGLVSAASNAVQVTVNAIPAKPVITMDASNALLSSAASGNQWYIDTTTVIAGASAQNYKPAATGNYTVRITQNGCTGPFSNKYYYLFTATIDLGGPGKYFQVAPNPVGDEFRVTYSLPGVTSLTIIMADINGREVLKKTGMHSGDRVTVSGLAGGQYLLKAFSKDGKLNITTQIIKMK